MNDTQSRAHLPHLARADVYRLLSACYYQPEAAFLEEDIFGQLKTAMAKASPQWVPEVAQLEVSFHSAGIDVLMLDYSRLFLGPFAILARPYGSVYLDGEKVVMGDSTMQALALYREGGFDVSDDFREVPDHVAVELEFLYLLSFRIAQAAEAAERKRLTALKQRFLREQLGRWVGSLADAMMAGAETDFYRQLAKLTAEFVHTEMQELTGTD